MLSSSINLQWPPFIQRAASDILTDYGPFGFGNRPVRTRTPGGVGAGGEKPPATRLYVFISIFLLARFRLIPYTGTLDVSHIPLQVVVLYLCRDRFELLKSHRT